MTNLTSLACGLYYKKHGYLKEVSTSPPKKSTQGRSRRPKSRLPQQTSVPPEPQSEPVCPSSPPTRPYEPMSEIDHPLLSEGICLPRMGYIRGDQNFEGDD